MLIPEEILKDWGFLEEYHNHKQYLVDLAGSVSSTTYRLLDPSPTPDICVKAGDCVGNLEYVISSSTLFREMWERHPSAHTPLRGVIVKALATHILNDNWQEIVRRYGPSGGFS